jgi:hypothetical protein
VRAYLLLVVVGLVSMLAAVLLLPVLLAVLIAG